MNSDIDILLPLGPETGDHYWETRFALRSIEKNANGWRRVIVLGKDPGFLSKTSDKILFVPLHEFPCNKEARISNKVVWAFKNISDISDYVAFWNDDYALLKPTDVRSIPFFRKREDLIKCANGSAGRYQTAIKTTGRMLTKEGHPMWQYDLHLPIVYHGDRFLELKWWWAQSQMTTHGLLVKSIYSNVWLPEPGPVHTDCKMQSIEELARAQDRFCFSYNDMAFNNGLKDWLKKQFPDPSSMEVS